LTTLHANGPRDALHRLENLVLMAGHTLPDKAIREQIASALEVVVHVSRMSDGSRKVLSIEEIVGMEGAVVTMQEIFRFNRTGTGQGGKILGRYEATGVVPHFAERVEFSGTDLSGIFNRTAVR
jgi:pilus assembly protein CpaF